MCPDMYNYIVIAILDNLADKFQGGSILFLPVLHVEKKQTKLTSNNLS